MQLVVVMAVRKAVSAATTTFTAISIIRFFIGLVVRQSVATVTAASAGIDHEGRSLGRHSEATRVDTTVRGQLDARTVDGCSGRCTAGGSDADLHLIVLVQRSARSHGVAIMSHTCTTATGLADGQRIARGLILIALLALAALLRLAAFRALFVGADDEPSSSALMMPQAESGVRRV